MREIKFRAWDKNEDEYWTWDRLIRCPYNQEYNILNNKSDIILSFMTDDGLILEQFTGFYDSTKWADLTEKERENWTKNGNMPSEWKGKEIYEGDIVQDERATMVGTIIYEPAKFISILKNGSQMFSNIVDSGYLTVKGNIHENGDLLK